MLGGGSVGCMMMNKERGRTPTPGRHGWGGGGCSYSMEGKGGMLVFQQGLDSSQDVRQSRKGVGWERFNVVGNS